MYAYSFSYKVRRSLTVALNRSVRMVRLTSTRRLDVFNKWCLLNEKWREMITFDPGDVMLFFSSRAAHSVLCGGRRQWVVLSAVAGDPTQSLHLPAEQSPKTGGKLRTHREGLLSEKLTCLCGISSRCHDYLLCSLNFSFILTGSSSIRLFIMECSELGKWQAIFLRLLTSLHFFS